MPLPCTIGPPRWGRVLGFSGVWTEWKKARCDSKVVRGNLGKEQEVGDLRAQRN